MEIKLTEKRSIPKKEIQEKEIAKLVEEKNGVNWFKM
jgi:hypothetical protein